MTVHQAEKVHLVSDVRYKVGPRLPFSIKPLCVKDGNVQEHWRAAQTVDPQYFVLTGSSRIMAIFPTRTAGTFR
jgi:hypothetical protein